MTDNIFYYDVQTTPIGDLAFLGHMETIYRIDFGNVEANEEKWKKWLKRYFGDVSLMQYAQPFHQAKKEFSEYFSGNRKEFSFSFTPMGTAFQKQVWNALLSIPFGETKTYKDMAEAIKNPKAVRAVGGAVNKNPFSVVVPCHRVIGTNGKLVGYAGGLDKKEYLLTFEKEKVHCNSMPLSNSLSN